MTSRVELKDIVGDAEDLLVRQHGFTRSGRRFLSEGELIRSVWFTPVGGGRFEIQFDLGIAGISAFSSKSQTWIVRCSGSRFRPKDVPARAWLTLTKGAYDEEVRKHAWQICECITGEFLLKYRNASPFPLRIRWSLLRSTPSSGGGRLMPNERAGPAVSMGRESLSVKHRLEAASRLLDLDPDSRFMWCLAHGPGSRKPFPNLDISPGWAAVSIIVGL